MKTWPMILYVLISSSLRALSSSESGSSSSEGFSDGSDSDGEPLNDDQSSSGENQFSGSSASYGFSSSDSTSDFSSNFEQLFNGSIITLTKASPVFHFSVSPGFDLFTVVKIVSIQGMEFTLAADYHKTPVFSEGGLHLPLNGIYDENGKLGNLKSQFLYFSEHSTYNLNDCALAVFCYDWEEGEQEFKEASFQVMVESVSSCYCFKGYCEVNKKCVCYDNFVNADCGINALDVSPESTQAISVTTNKYFYVVVDYTSRGDPADREMVNHYYDGIEEKNRVMKYERVEIELKVSQGMATFYIMSENYPENRVPSQYFNDFNKTISEGEIFIFHPEDYLVIQSPSPTRIIILAENEDGLPSDVEVSITSTKYKVSSPFTPSEIIFSFYFT